MFYLSGTTVKVHHPLKCVILNCQTQLDKLNFSSLCHFPRAVEVLLVRLPSFVRTRVEISSPEPGTLVRVRVRVDG